ncbi:MAG: hypothetical protein LBK47_02480 [Prevotellaceae bacterium]|nr:hypothetical protein [Prevotellaceae bacterium]
MNVQKHLFDIIKSLIPEQYRLVDVVEDLLKISQDSAYRRIRGEKELTLSEVQKLCRHYHLSMDEILNNEAKQGSAAEQDVLFQYMPIDAANQPDCIRYLERLSEPLTALSAVEDTEMFFTAQDIPFYHFLNHTELLYFKLYVWYDIATQSRISFREFCNRLDTTNIRPVYDRMYQAYLKIPSKEIWTNQTVDATLRSLDFYMEIGAFDNKEVAICLLNQLSKLLDTVNDHTQKGYKDNEKQIPFSMYICSVDMENNFMLTRHGNQCTCTIKLYTINNIVTSHAALCQEAENWINDLLQKSVQISGRVSIRERVRFFQTSKSKIEEQINKIEQAKR